MASFVPMMTAAIAAADALHQASGSSEHKISVVLADAGYCSNHNLNAPGPGRLITLGKGRDQAAAAYRDPRSRPTSSNSSAAHRLRTTEGVADYKRRGATVEHRNPQDHLRLVLATRTCRYPK